MALQHVLANAVEEVAETEIMLANIDIQLPATLQRLREIAAAAIRDIASRASAGYAIDAAPAAIDADVGNGVEHAANVMPVRATSVARSTPAARSESPQTEWLHDSAPPTSRANSPVVELDTVS